MKKVMITGSLGYVGSVLTKYLLDHGFDVEGIDIGFFKDCTIVEPKSQPFRKIDARQLTKSDFEGFDAVVHLAGISNDPMNSMNDDDVYTPSREYTKKIATWCKELGVKFIFASSCSVYGIGGDEKVSEEFPVNPQTGYSKNKCEIENDLSALADGSFSPTALRFATIFGMSPRIRFDIVINMFVAMALTEKKIVLNSDGCAWRPNLHILDACKSIMWTLESSHSSGSLSILNVGSDENNHRIIDLAQIVASRVEGTKVIFLSDTPKIDKEGLIRDRKVNAGSSDTRTYAVSFERLKEEYPNFSCDWNVDRGVADLIKNLEGLKLSRDTFKNVKFYRLQKLEQLLATGQITRDLRWR